MTRVLIVSLLTFLATSPSFSQENKLGWKVPPIVAGDCAKDERYYNCHDMIRTLNYLRGLGKEKCLLTLRGWGETYSDRSLVLCRLLFVNPDGWPPPSLGKPGPKLNEDMISRFPFFPVALSNGVPFCLVRGYTIEGLGEPALPTLIRCETLHMVDRDFSLNNLDDAAKSLIDSVEFQKLYDDETKNEMIRIIKSQIKAPTGKLVKY